ncbi:DUF4160 domain-containing protein [bacterium]|nr:DUF4160 domain-containing protein [bacterium]
MPTVLTVGPYRLYCHASDKNEFPPVHVKRDDKVAEYWLQPVGLNEAAVFGPEEIRRVQPIMDNHREELVEAWNEYFGD